MLTYLKVHFLCCTLWVFEFLAKICWFEWSSVWIRSIFCVFSDEKLAKNELKQTCDNERVRVCFVCLYYDVLFNILILSNLFNITCIFMKGDVWYYVVSWKRFSEFCVHVMSSKAICYIQTYISSHKLLYMCQIRQTSN